MGLCSRGLESTIAEGSSCPAPEAENRLNTGSAKAHPQVTYLLQQDHNPNLSKGSPMWTEYSNIWAFREHSHFTLPQFMCWLARLTLELTSDFWLALNSLISYNPLSFLSARIIDMHFYIQFNGAFLENKNLLGFPFCISYPVIADWHWAFRIEFKYNCNKWMHVEHMVLRWRIAGSLRNGMYRVYLVR